MVFYDTASLLGLPLWLIIIVIAWSLLWKGLALWKSARRGSMIWFVVLLVVNTLGILEILYYYLFSEMKFEGKNGKNRNKEKLLRSKSRNNKAKNKPIKLPMLE